MKIAVYDGSFEGFLCIVNFSIFENLYFDGIIKSNSFNVLSIFNTYVEIETSHSKAQETFSYLRSQIPEEHLSKLMLALLCDEMNLEITLYRVIIKILKEKSLIENILDDDVLRLNKALKNLFNERHKYLGSVRFQKVEKDHLLAIIEPRNNILPLIAKHFVKRFPNEYWCIYDKKRRLILSKNDRNWEIFKVEGELNLNLKTDREISNLWRQFFKNIAIKNRINPKAQKNRLPLRFRTYMTEFLENL